MPCRPRRPRCPAGGSLDRDRLGGELSAFLRAGDLVLLKGSRSLELEGLLPRMTAMSARQPNGPARDHVDEGGGQC